jgi:mono/diheme cytochrome c family protein
MIRIAAVALVLIAATSAWAQSPQVERGRYLVDAVMACDGCHTPRGPTGFNMERRFSGGSQVWDEPAYTVRGSNITPDPETGIGGWSADDVKRLMVDGKRPNGVLVSHQMPYPFYKILTPGDLDAVVAYVQTIKPVRNAVPPPVYKTAWTTELVPRAEKSVGDAVPTDPVQRGFYFATIAHCMECHSRTPDGRQDYKNWQGKGGYVFKGPFGQVTTSNITSHREKGIGAWTDGEIRRALVEGVGRDGRAFKTPMARQIYFSKMTDQDLNALIAWVRTIPPGE